MKIPQIHNIEKIILSHPEEISLKNNIRLFGFKDNKNDILKIDLIFNSGRWTEPAKLVAETTATLFKSGTANLTAFELSEKIDYYGTTIKASAGYNTFNVSLYCMNRYLEASLQLLLTCLTELIFPEEELELFQKNSISKLKISQEKNDYLADVSFKKAVYGKSHPYGYETTETDLKNITRQLLTQFYKQDIQPENCAIFIAGKFAERELYLINEYLGKWSAGGVLQSTSDIQHPVESSAQKKIYIKKEKSVQASIIIGKELFNRHNEDYASFVLLNTIFGGYFGSRLMGNIREEKGLTYGIYSGLAALKYDGIFSIQTDTNLENLDLCLSEIYLEMERLQHELIPQQEITLAKNYLLGKFLGRTDGVFNQVEVYKSYFIENININKFEEVVETIKQTNALSLQRLAQKYLLKESMYEVIVG